MASAARTLQCGSGSSPDSTATKLSGSSAASRAQRRGAHRRARIGQQVEQHVGDAPARVQAAERADRLEPHLRIGAGVADDSVSSGSAADASPMRPSARTSRSAPSASPLVSSGISTGSAARSFDRRRAPSRRTRACTDSASFASVSSAGSARLSSSRCSANATGHQRTRGCPLASSTAAASCGYAFRRTSA